MTVNPNSAQGQQAMAAANTPDPMMLKMMELMKEGKYAEAQELQKQLDAKAKNAPPPPSTRLTVQVSFNISAQGVHQLPRSLRRFRTSRRRHGALFARHAGIGRRIRRRPRHLGSAWPWSQPTATHLDGETTKVITKAPLNPSAPRLSIQNIAVYLNCDHDLAAKAILAIDWSQLRALLAH